MLLISLKFGQNLQSLIFANQNLAREDIFFTDYRLTRS